MKTYGNGKIECKQKIADWKKWQRKMVTRGWGKANKRKEIHTARIEWIKDYKMDRSSWTKIFDSKQGMLNTRER